MKSKSKRFSAAKKPSKRMMKDTSSGGHSDRGLSIQEAFARIEEIRKHSNLPKGLSMKELIEEGRDRRLLQVLRIFL